MHPLPFYLALADVCRLTRLSPVTVWRRVRRGTFPAATFAGSTRLGWERDRVLAWRRHTRK